MIFSSKQSNNQKYFHLMIWKQHETFTFWVNSTAFLRENLTVCWINAEIFSYQDSLDKLMIIIPWHDVWMLEYSVTYVEAFQFSAHVVLLHSPMLLQHCIGCFAFVAGKGKFVYLPKSLYVGLVLSPSVGAFQRFNSPRNGFSLEALHFGIKHLTTFTIVVLFLTMNDLCVA